ncbi:MAG: hypothetical protein LUG18_05610 [Candidatus Azobacteroides sp.]|nr:hypothetical protein [Candidatus Azobacteroides sp.]
MKIYNVLLISFLYILLVSCTKISFIGGNYSDKNSHVFTFLQDSIFQYEYQGYCYSESLGTWSKEGNSLYLNSFIQTDKIPLEYTKIKKDTDSIITVHIEINSQKNLQDDYICWPFINGELYLFESVRGSYSFKSEVPIDEIYFKIRKSPFIIRGTGSKMCYDDIETERINLKSFLGEEIHIQINMIDSLFGYRVFKN